MASSKQGKSGDKGQAKAAPKAEEAKAERSVEKDEAEHGSGEHGHDDHGHGHGGAAHAAHAHHDHKPNIREYMVIFVVLAVLTVVEVGVAKVPGVGKAAMSLALVGLALTKAAIVALFYMHLKHETKVLKFTVALPMAAPTIYALVLISEAAWRLHR